MEEIEIKHVSAQEGYNHWSTSYDKTPNPVVSMDNRHTSHLLNPREGEKILDAGCGTGRHFGLLLSKKSQVYGMDFAFEMLKVAAGKSPTVPLIQADLQSSWPLKEAFFDKVLCALVGEHLESLIPFFREIYRVLVPTGEVLFSVYHPEMAAKGFEANFQKSGIEFRLGAYTHTIEDYKSSFMAAGFEKVEIFEYKGDEHLVQEIPKAKKFLNFPLLLILKGKKTSF